MRGLKEKHLSQEYGQPVFAYSMKKAKAGLSCLEKKISNLIWKLRRMRSPECSRKIRHQSEHFGDFIVKYMQNVENTMELFPGTTFSGRLMRFSEFFMYRWKIQESWKLPGHPTIPFRNAIHIWIWRRPVHRESPDCMTILILS